MTPTQASSTQTSRTLTTAPVISPEAWKLFIPILVISVIMAFLFWQTAVVMLLLGFAVLFFFRDPRRTVARNARLLLSPADATVAQVHVLQNERFESGQTQCLRLNVGLGQVAVQRAPFDCHVEDLERPKGRKRSVIIWLKSEQQLLGLQFIAANPFSKVFCNVKIGDRFSQGQRIGIIPFGARVNVYLDSEIDLRLDFGSRLVAGQTPLAAAFRG